MVRSWSWLTWPRQTRSNSTWSCTLRWIRSAALACFESCWSGGENKKEGLKKRSCAVARHSFLFVVVIVVVLLMCLCTIQCPLFNTSLSSLWASAPLVRHTNSKLLLDCDHFLPSLWPKTMRLATLLFGWPLYLIKWDNFLATTGWLTSHLVTSYGRPDL